MEDIDNKSTRNSSVYQPLDPQQQEFRLLDVEPGSGEEVVECNLRPASFKSDDTPKYETVSYVWGDPAVRGSINLNGIQTDIPAGAERALRYFRWMFAKRTLWIDAVCINQSDVRERAEQVLLMGEVYGNTERNLIYLGEQQEYTTAAVSSLEEVVNDLNHHTALDQDLLRALFAHNGDPPMIDDAISFQFAEQAVAKFLDHPWFDRLWVVQEAALAAINICFQGTYKIRLEELLRAAVWIEYNVDHMDIAPAFRENLRRARRLQAYVDRDLGYRSFERQQSGPRIEELLVNFIGLSASQPHDHVYGLLGFAQKTIGRSAIVNGLMPDYQKPVQEVFATATKRCIVECQGLDILPIVESRGELQSLHRLPSWCMDFSRAFSLVKGVSEIEYNLFDAAAETEPDISAFDQSHAAQLPLKGFVVDKLQAVSETIERQMFGIIHTLSSLLEGAKEFSNDGHCTLEDAETSLQVAMSLTAGVACNEQRWTSRLECTKSWNAYVPMLLTAPHHIVEEPSSLPSDIAPERRLASEMQIAISRVANGRRLFYTEKSCFGLGPRTSKEGDIVVILYGSNLPVVLRPCNTEDGTYEFVGVCYIDDIMDGEAVEKHRAENGEDTIFILI